jgi:hypothetical protein
MKRKVILTLTLVLFMALITSCVPGDGKATPLNPANMLWGIWHGWIAPFSLIISLFKNRSIYEIYNTGFWYDLGFYAAIISGFGGLSLSRKKKNASNRNRED